MTNITIYTTNYCSFCRSAKAFFDMKGLPYREVDVTGDDAARQDLVDRTGRHTVPQIYIGETHIGGYDDLRQWDREGRLAAVLNG